MSSGWKGVLESFRPFLVDAMGRSQQGSDHHAPVAAVTPDHDIGDDPPGEIIVILEGKVESSGRAKAACAEGGCEEGTFWWLDREFEESMKYMGPKQRAKALEARTASRRKSGTYSPQRP